MFFLPCSSEHNSRQRHRSAVHWRLRSSESNTRQWLDAGGQHLPSSFHWSDRGSGGQRRLRQRSNCFHSAFRHGSYVEGYKYLSAGLDELSLWRFELGERHRVWLERIASLDLHRWNQPQRLVDLHEKQFCWCHLLQAPYKTRQGQPWRIYVVSNAL